MLTTASTPAALTATATFVAVLVILSDSRQVCCQELRNPGLLHQPLSPFRDWEVDVFDRFPDLCGQHLGHLADRHVLGPRDDVMLADVRFGIVEDAYDDTRDIFSRDSGVLAFPERKIQFSLLRDALA